MNKIYDVEADLCRLRAQYLFNRLDDKLKDELRERVKASSLKDRSK